MRRRSLLAALRFRLAHLNDCVGSLRLPAVAVRWMVRRDYLITARGLDSELPAVPPLDGERWRSAEARDLDVMLAADPTLEPDEVERRLWEGQACRVCYLDGSAVHWRWQTTVAAHLRYLGCSLQPADGDLLITEVLTRRDQRGRGLHARSALRALHEARDAGHRRLVGLVAPWNRPALRVMCEVSGREVVGRLGFRRVRDGRRYFAEGAATINGDGLLRLLPGPV